MSQATTVPDVLEILFGEVLNLTVDMFKQIAPGDVISAPTTTIINASTNETISTALSSPFVSGSSIINVTLNSSKLRPKSTYYLQFNCTSTGGSTSKPESCVLVVKVIQ